MSRACSGLVKISPSFWEQAWDLLIACTALPWVVSGPAEFPKLGALAPVFSMSGVALSWCRFLCPTFCPYHRFFLTLSPLPSPFSGSFHSNPHVL